MTKSLHLNKTDSVDEPVQERGPDKKMQPIVGILPTTPATTNAPSNVQRWPRVNEE
jgi:hypothetical protein